MCGIRNTIPDPHRVLIADSPVHDMIQQVRLGPEPRRAVLDVLLMGPGVLADVGSDLVPVTHDDD